MADLATATSGMARSSALYGYAVLPKVERGGPVRPGVKFGTGGAPRLFKTRRRSLILLGCVRTFRVENQAENLM